MKKLLIAMLFILPLSFSVYAAEPMGERQFKQCVEMAEDFDRMYRDAKAKDDELRELDNELTDIDTALQTLDWHYGSARSDYVICQGQYGQNSSYCQQYAHNINVIANKYNRLNSEYERRINNFERTRRNYLGDFERFKRFEERFFSQCDQESVRRSHVEKYCYSGNRFCDVYPQ